MKFKIISTNSTLLFIAFITIMTIIFLVSFFFSSFTEANAKDLSLSRKEKQDIIIYTGKVVQLGNETYNNKCNSEFPDQVGTSISKLVWGLLHFHLIISINIYCLKSNS